MDIALLIFVNVRYNRPMYLYLLIKTLHFFLQDDEDLAMSPNAVSTYLIDQHHVYETRIDPMRAGVASYATMPRRPIKVKTASSAGSAISSFRQHPHHRSHYGEQLKREAYIQSLGNRNVSSRFFYNMITLEYYGILQILVRNVKI